MLKNKIKNKRIWATLLLLVILGGVLGGATLLNYQLEKQRCFQRLNSYVANISQLVAQDMEENQAYLESIGQVLSGRDLSDYQEVGALLGTVGRAGSITRLELLFPSELLLCDDGRLTDVSGRRSFDQEVEKGAHIFWEKGDTEGSIVLHQCVPVEQNGEMAALLCSVIDLKQVTRLFFAQEYGEDMQLYIFERGSGQFLLDTWHNTLPTQSDLGGREPAKGYSREQFAQAIAEGQAGTAVFRSSTTGEYFYTSYAPVDVEDWMVMVTVPDRVVFAYAERLLRFLYVLMAGLIAVFLVYFFWTLGDIRRNQRISERKLKNIHYILDVEKDLFQAHTGPAYLHNALKKIAEFLPAEKAFYWRLNGYLPQQKRWWSGGSEEILEREDWFQTRFPGLLKQLQDQGTVICYDAVRPEEQQLFGQLHSNSLMLVPVRKRDGTLTGILGAVNVAKNAQSAEPLEQVAVSFSVTSEQYDTYQRLDRLSHLDAMTGLQNRNGFHDSLYALEKERLDCFACVYVDVNGLHEINNHLGHAAGDKMLIRVAEILRDCFPDEAAYRVGGDEFVVLCRNKPQQQVLERARRAQMLSRQDGYEISLGTVWRDRDFNPSQVVKDAEQEMRVNKRRYYAGPDRERHLRLLDEKTVQMFARQKDMEIFLTFLEPQFKGVYFVDLEQDSVRHLFIPSYFERILAQEDGKFSKGLLLYASQLVKPDYYGAFAQLCDYGALQEQLDRGDRPQLRYQKNDGRWLQLYVIQTSTDLKQETLWVFMDGS